MRDLLIDVKRAEDEKSQRLEYDVSGADVLKSYKWRQGGGHAEAESTKREKKVTDDSWLTAV